MDVRLIAYNLMVSCVAMEEELVYMSGPPHPDSYYGLLTSKEQLKHAGEILKEKGVLVLN